MVASCMQYVIFGNVLVCGCDVTDIYCARNVMSWFFNYANTL